MPDKVKVLLALPVSADQREQIEAVSARLEVMSLGRAQRLAWREGRPLWAGYQEPPPSGDETAEEARARLDAILSEAEVILSNPMAPADVLDRAPKLRWLQLTSAGVDRLLDAPVVRAPGVEVTTASGIHAVPISEFVLGAMLAFAKGFPNALRAQAEGNWSPYLPEELAEKTVGILGFGAIGSRVAALAHAFGMEVLAIRRSVGSRHKGDGHVSEFLPPSELPYLLGESDYVVVAVPLTQESRHMIGETELRSMKPTAVIVNIARGAVIDESALVWALKEGWIAGAALDVFEQEPLAADSELWKLPSVLLTPHVSGGTPRYMERAIDLFCDNLHRYLEGRPLLNVVDSQRGY
ncbi:MAG TPA: D-2-hydroxyacid dehydrogenase [Dehalococcoidia bacterium]|nr:D-2-hydroxyacid dehydrogenase [Dehalococcoidia bacterium]